jgi:hypothetical protein
VLSSVTISSETHSTARASQRAPDRAPPPGRAAGT